MTIEFLRIAAIANTLRTEVGGVGARCLRLQGSYGLLQGIFIAATTQFKSLELTLKLIDYSSFLFVSSAFGGRLRSCNLTGKSLLLRFALLGLSLQLLLVSAAHSLLLRLRLLSRLLSLSQSSSSLSLPFFSLGGSSVRRDGAALSSYSFTLLLKGCTF